MTEWLPLVVVALVSLVVGFFVIRAAVLSALRRHSLWKASDEFAAEREKYARRHLFGE